MTTTLEPVLAALGYKGEAEQRGLVRLMQAAGVFGELPGVEGIISDRQAGAILKSVTFDNSAQAALWLHKAAQKHLPSGILTRQVKESLPKLLEMKEIQTSELPPPLAMLDPAAIKADPAVYQYRSGGDAAGGVTQKCHIEADLWDAVLHGNPVLVHERLDGSHFIADGHHRLDLAKRLNAEGKGPGKIAAIVLREAEGYTPQDVKLIAAYRNMAEQARRRLDAREYVDQARVFKEAESLPFDRRKLLPTLKLEGNVTLSYHLSKLPEPALAQVARGEVPVDMAAKVPEFAPNDPEKQMAVMEALSGRFVGRVRQERAKEIMVQR